jgi:hypothetical protein
MLSVFCPYLRVFVTFQILKHSISFQETRQKPYVIAIFSVTFLNLFPLVIKIQQMCELVTWKGH